MSLEDQPYAIWPLPTSPTSFHPIHHLILHSSHIGLRQALSMSYSFYLRAFAHAVPAA